MAKILLIESTTEVCSVAIAVDKKIAVERENSIGRTHAAELAVFIDTCINEWNDAIESIDAIAVSMGPGSYTGLRIGVSTAKGLCYALGKPLIAIPTLKSLAQGFIETYSITEGILCPLLDARRNEVYYALYNTHLTEIQEVEPHVLDESSFSNELSKGAVYFFGNGTAKTAELIRHAQAHYYPDFLLSAKYMAPLAEEAFLQQKFEDVAYFEPFYLKEFITTTPKNSVLKGLLGK